MLIVKIGGGEGLNIEGIVQDLAAQDCPIVVVHGANYWRDLLAQEMGIELKRVTSVSGYSSVVSDSQVIDLQMMAYAGLRNKRLVELCQRSGLNAIGLSGLDGGLIRARRNPGIKVQENQRKRLVRDFSGKPIELNLSLLRLLLDQGFTPVITMPLLDEQGFAVNSENDDVIALLHRELRAERVVSFIEEAGFLKDPDDSESLVETMSRVELLSWEVKATGRIKRKLKAFLKLMDQGASQVILADGRGEHPLINALAGRGTVFQ